MQSFQSTPANFTAGDTALRRTCAETRVSIHARQFHSGRPARPATTAARLPGFNPRPPISQRATQSGSCGFSRCGCFNPRPPISQRATVDARGECHGWRGFQSTPANFTAGDSARSSPAAWRCRGFNPRPPISQRATDIKAQTGNSREVSIHARQFHSGRPQAPAAWASTSRFQSTPANFTAGDHHLDQPPDGRLRVSIHARQFHSGRPTLTRPHDDRHHRFNPRPPISQRATTPIVPAVYRSTWFQSTPANFTAGDPRRVPL